MKLIIAFIVFCLVLFIYLHVQFNLKTSDDLEMYELDDFSKDKLEEVCDMRQPVLLDFDNQKIIDTTNLATLQATYSAFELKIRNVKEEDFLYMPLTLANTKKLFDEDKDAKYITELNADFLEETGVVKNFSYNDELLRPYMVSWCEYDILSGTKCATTPLKYELNFRNYFMVTQGSATIKLAPPKSAKYLNTVYDYDNFEFRSPINVWTKEVDKVKCLEFELVKGKTLFIPAYWYYSIKFEENTSISCFKYRTYMNTVAIAPYLAKSFLQQHNIKRESVPIV